jgi:hypothetical protein
MQNGLYKFDPRTKNVEQFDDKDGLQSNRFYYAAAESRSGKILFGGENGFNIFHPDSIHRNAHRPNVTLTGFRVYDRPRHINTLDTSDRLFSMCEPGLTFL